MHSLYALGARFVYIRTRSITIHSPARSERYFQRLWNGHINFTQCVCNGKIKINCNAIIMGVRHDCAMRHPRSLALIISSWNLVWWRQTRIGNPRSSLTEQTHRTRWLVEAAGKFSPSAHKFHSQMGASISLLSTTAISWGFQKCW
jgi:hypothetical protein